MSKITIRNYFLIQIAVIFCNNMFSQIGVGEWRDHLSYKNAKDIIEVGDKIYCSTKSGIFIFNKIDYTYQKFSKIHGLSDININAIAYSEEHDLVIIGYLNGNIDLIENDKIINFPDIKRKIITAEKTINSISVIDDYAYLACGFGIVVFNLNKKEIKDTYQLIFNDNILNISDLDIYHNYIYAGSELGLFKGNINKNLVDYQNWEYITNLPDSSNSIDRVVTTNNNLYICQEQSDSLSRIFFYKEQNWQQINNLPFKRVNAISIVDDNLVISFEDEINFLNSDHLIVNTIDSYELYPTKPQPYKLYKDSDGYTWIADYVYGLVLYNNIEFSNYFPNGPYNNDCWTLTYQDGYLWVSGGGYNESYNNLWKAALIMNFKDEVWNSNIYYSATDVINIAIDPDDPEHIYTGSFGSGLLEIKNNEIINAYNETNSEIHPLQSIIPGAEFTRIGGITFDNQKNLWVTGYNVKNLLNVLTSEGEWHGIPLGSMIGTITVGDIIVTKNNHKWMVLTRGNGLLAYDENQTPGDLDDDNFEMFTVFNEDNKVITSDVFSIAEDDEGDIWVGTNLGVYVFHYPENVFSDDLFYASDILIPRNDGTSIVDRLLETESVTCIKIDGGNRKWFGTKSAGVFLFSADGMRQIYNFNTNNSPLLSDYIIDIEINGKTGEVFFSTTNGIISYKSAGADENLQGDLTYVYPNPVRENYTGPITIAGLYKDANVKITDISGNIVYETTTIGGQAIWNGIGLNGERVKTGVYLVFCTTKDGTKSKMTKFLVIN